MQRRDLTDSECSRAALSPACWANRWPPFRLLSPWRTVHGAGAWSRDSWCGPWDVAILRLPCSWPGGNHSAALCRWVGVAANASSSKCFKLISPHGEIARHCLALASGSRKSGSRHKDARIRLLGISKCTGSCCIVYKGLSHLPAVCSQLRLSASNLFMIKCLYWRQYQKLLGHTPPVGRSVVVAIINSEFHRSAGNGGQSFHIAI